MTTPRFPGYYWIKVHRNDVWEPAAYEAPPARWWTLGWEVPLYDEDIFAIGPRAEPPNEPPDPKTAERGRDPEPETPETP